jgi:large subunit ribosomal protein L9
MKVILKETVKSLGNEGDVINVSAGYARNYLLPRGLAMEATTANLKQLQKIKALQAQKQAEEEAAAKQLAARLQGKKIVVRAKAGESGKLFGSITGQEIARALEQDSNIKVDKRKIELKEPLKSLGEHTVTIRLYKELTAEIIVKVESGE